MSPSQTQPWLSVPRGAELRTLGVDGGTDHSPGPGWHWGSWAERPSWHQLHQYTNTHHCTPDPLYTLHWQLTHPRHLHTSTTHLYHGHCHTLQIHLYPIQTPPPTQTHKQALHTHIHNPREPHAHRHTHPTYTNSLRNTLHTHPPHLDTHLTYTDTHRPLSPQTHTAMRLLYIPYPYTHAAQMHTPTCASQSHMPWSHLIRVQL